MKRLTIDDLQLMGTKSHFIILIITLLAFFLRVWRLADVPLGWRDDELINVLVISQKVLDGDWQVYYADASGNEALYHALNAVMLGLFGPNVISFRLVSAVIGTLAIPTTYALGRKLFNSAVGLVASAGLALSFWSLMYSRFGLRQILTPLLALLAFYSFWRALRRRRSATGYWSLIIDYLPPAIFMAMGFYTYFASRGVPLIVLVFCGYLLLFARPLFKRNWVGFGMMFVGTAVLVIPLLLTLRQQPGAEARVAELAAPLIEAREGDFSLIQEYTLTTLSMFHQTGDDEWLYNIPGRPVFGLTGAVFMWVGVVMAFGYTVRAVLSKLTTDHWALSTTFLLLWFLAGISPGFISVPPASLGHTIVAQPAVYLLAALPIGLLANGYWKVKPITNNPLRITIGLSLVFLLSMTLRDLPDYFQVWPQRGMVRFLYHADVKEAADYLNHHPELVDVGISNTLDGPWARLALEMDLQRPIRTRWYNPERAIFLQPEISFTGYPATTSPYESFLQPSGVQIGGYHLSQVTMELETADPVCFQNGLCLISAVFHDGVLELGWWVERPLDLPPMPLISNPPPPGVYAGPRLWVFAQLQDAAGNFLVGNDGLWVDPATLYPGDLFMQQHWLMIPEGSVADSAVFGLYDPMTGSRILTEDGRDSLRLTIR